MRYFQVRYGCGHRGILLESQLQKDVKGQELNLETMTPENLHTCEACLNGEPGFCSKTTLHPITSVRKMSPLEVMQALRITPARR